MIRPAPPRDVLERLTPPGLVAPAAWTRLLHAATSLPPSTGGGIECHLTDPDRADLAVRYFDGELQAVAEAATTAQLAGFARLAAAPGRAGRRIGWLELDVPAQGAPLVSVFAGPGYPPGGAPANLPDVAEWDAILSALWPAAPAAVAAHLRRLLAALPAGAWMGYLGFMRGRDLRATISGVAAEAVPALLVRIGWPGDPARIAPVLDAARHLRSRLTLGLAVGETIEAPFGIELGLDEHADRDALLQAAATLAPLPAASAAALRAWEGDDGKIVRRLNHLKFGFTGAAVPVLKAYLYYGLQ